MKTSRVTRFLVPVLVGTLLALTRPGIAAESSEATELPIEDLRLFAEIFSLIKSSFNLITII